MNGAMAVSDRPQFRLDLNCDPCQSSLPDHPVSIPQTVVNSSVYIAIVRNPLQTNGSVGYLYLIEDPIDVNEIKALSCDIESPTDHVVRVINAKEESLVRKRIIERGIDSIL